MKTKLALALSTALIAATAAMPASAHEYGGEGGYQHYDIARDRADMRQDWNQLAQLRVLANQYAFRAQQARRFGDWRVARQYAELRQETLERIRRLERDMRHDRRDLRHDRRDRY